MPYVTRHGLAVDAELAHLTETEILRDITPDRFWAGYAAILRDLMPVNAALLARRQALQAQIDAWHIARKGQPHDQSAYLGFLREIGYLVEPPAPFEVSTGNVDDEIAKVSGAQLVVPITNARFAINAANARWGSLYDAFYGTDAIEGAPEGRDFDAVRGGKVIARVRAHLDQVAPLAEASWASVTALEVVDGALAVTTQTGVTTLEDAAQFAGYSEGGDIMLRVNGLLIRIVIDASTVIGAVDLAGISDVIAESAMTAIQDFEDSIAAVDAADKCAAYRNWLGLMRGDLSARFTKGGREMTRSMAPDVTYLDPQGQPVTHPGRALLLVRNVGHLMDTDAVLFEGAPTPEGIMDAMVTVAAALHDLAREGVGNSRKGSIYVVKPKMHGPEEVAFANTLYGRVEEVLGLAPNTVKLGIMDEERRSSANLRACIAAVRERCVFINTGFLDRTGDEIRTSTYAGPVVPKAEMKAAAWFDVYEARNVFAGLGAGMTGRGQIGKGMWAKPDMMAEMIAMKIGHPMAGATTAWVPSPTAATLHALHYHLVDVAARQAEIAQTEEPALETLLTLPLLGERVLSEAEIGGELDNSCQSILGYVVRWVDQGIGCSKVPDIHDVGLMEDRATLRISAQHLSNWLLHGLLTVEQVEDSLQRMALKVDAQNAGDAAYRPMAPAYAGPAYDAARALIFEGTSQPSGYTEPLLHLARRAAKAVA
ncbi:malate synthase G (plasmid) [Thioclava sp. 'Guangxiensis']|uniref:malate synthase G n=1 Tax=Thioclava sp. 'Guangxiensis' TaxID=3149044 RepID=UPI0032C40DFD